MNERTRRTKVVFAVCFLVIMAAFGTASVIAFLQNQAAKRVEQAPAVQDVTPVTSFRTLYPFSDENGADERAQETESSDSPVSRFASRIRALTASVEAYTAQWNPLPAPLCNALFRFDDLTGNRVVQNGDEPFVRLENGYMVHIVPYTDPQETEQNVLSFSEWLEAHGSRLLVLIPAYKSDDSVTVFPEGVPHGYAQMNAAYTAFLTEHQIPYLDAKPVLLAENADFYSWFYKTDHHWNARAGLLMAGQTAAYLNRAFGLPADADAVSPDNFSLSVYPDSFLGSMGQKLGETYREDMEVWFPNEEAGCETQFHIQIPSKGIDKTGTFADTLVADTCLKGNTSYAAFLYGDMPLIRIENQSCQNGTRLLVIKKSNANVLNTYLAFTVQYLDIIDPRHFDGSIRTFIEQTSPDAVILCAGLSEEGDDFYNFK